MPDLWLVETGPGVVVFCAGPLGDLAAQARLADESWLPFARCRPGAECPARSSPAAPTSGEPTPTSSTG
ncbi:hypothetical protein [Actinomadura sp. DC4]|uniref:hypothetical protein n=1 Tax=Actinomadura sp. DC4 TaxID=3055069 RepID=UPI0025B1D1C6|nr:hypothetical protein [Actinomadura sp. DC4]MDN3351068.1 hypothetical protein [Actinomadura sp. DC4]